MDVGTMPAQPVALLFNREHEKTPRPKRVLDFTYLVDEFAVKEIKERKPREGDKAVSDLPPFAVEKDGTVMQLVSHEYVLALLKSPPCTRPLSDYSIEALRRTGITDEEELEALARSGRAMQRMRDNHNDIIKQYLDKGYAYIALTEDRERYPLSAGKQLPPLP